MILPVIAWRNIWRNPTRSAVLIGAITVGIWSLIFITGFMQGITVSYIRQAIETRTSHIQVHDPEFKDDMEIKYMIEDQGRWERLLSSDDQVKAYSLRTKISGMLSTSRGSYGVVLEGVDPGPEALTTKLSEQVVEGIYMDTSQYNPIMVSSELAKKLKAKIQSKVVFQFQQLDGEISAAAFRVSGIYDSGNAKADQGKAYAYREDINKLADLPQDATHEIAILLQDISMIDTIRDQWQAQFPDLLVESYAQISPDLKLFESQIQISMLTMTIIFMLALIFGIINTMLMAVLERVKELGMLMAIGMNRWRVFVMIMLETITLALVAAPLGLLLGWRTIEWLGRTGVDLSIYAEGMKQFGMAAMVYPEIDAVYYVQILSAVCTTAVIGAIYPAWKAIHLKPVEALRKL